MHLIFQILNQIALSAMKRSEVVGAALVLAVVFMMIIPLPNALVDVLIAVNISLSALLVSLATYLPGPLAFSTFPAVLLLTTMFRLALSISTTRLILLEQDAGDIVEAFGNFVVGGNLAVGMVMFLILTLVNFMVITKGSERVAEVAARFTLDAMPGKQMSIDSDLRANLISPMEAKRKREALGQESKLFGAMDGAMKFVKGDAIAGLIIVAINLIGGFAIGNLQYGMSAGESIKLYSILTIGDGLVAQIPALLISLTAGMIITRVAPDNDGGEGLNVGREMTQQILSQPKAWIIAAFGMFGFALLPGMPTTIFIIIACLSMTSGCFQLYKAKMHLNAALSEQDETPPEMNGNMDIRIFMPSVAYTLHFPKALAEADTTKRIIELARRCRNRIVTEYGLTLPNLEIEFKSELEEDEFRFCVYDVPYLRATNRVDRLAIPGHSLSAEESEQGTLGRSDREEESWVWFPTDHPLLSKEGLRPATAEAMIQERIERLLFATGPQFIGLQETKSLIGWIESEFPELANELQRAVPTTRFAAILQRLASESIPIRAMRPIAESLIEHAQYERDIGALTDAIRISLKAQICHQYADQDGLHVWLLTPETEEHLRDSLRQTQTETFFALPPEISNLLIQQLRTSFPVMAMPTPVLLVAQDLRRNLRNLLVDEFNHVPVLSFAELQSTAQINVLGRISLEV